MRWTAQDFANELARLKGLPLCAVILYGSAAAGDYAGAQSDINLLCVLERIGRDELDRLAGPVRRWTRAGHSPPLLFARDRLLRSADVFPIELQDLKETGQVLYGEDVLAEVRIQPEHLRIEIEHELRGKLAHLQGQYLRVRDSDRALRALLADSVSTFLVLARALLRFFEKEVPKRKLDALRALGSHTPVDVEAFAAVQAVKERRAKPRGAVLRAWVERYLAAVEQLVMVADTQLDSEGRSLLPFTASVEKKERPA
jgi:predicted nucleotidyltransferase